MSHNSFGHLFRVSTWGESHGVAIGCVIDGMPPGIPLATSDIQPFLDARRPGGSRFTSQRREADKVRILSGTCEDPKNAKRRLTTGTPIALEIENTDARGKDYDDIRDAYRPGHADFTYQAKYGIRDYRGGGRQSARETAMRVAAGAVARKILGRVKINGAVVQLGPHRIEPGKRNFAQARKNPLFCPDAASLKTWEKYLDDVRKRGSSCGAVIEIVAEGLPAGLGAPIYGKLDAELAAALMGINAVKGVEIGAGFAAAALSGEENADAMRMKGKRAHFMSNNAGGVLGGISTGAPLIARFAVKPTSSIHKAQKTITRQGKETDVSVKGRHDPCVGLRAVPVGEAMVACVLADHVLRHRAQTGKMEI